MMLREIEYENASTERKPSLSFDPNVGERLTNLWADRCGVRSYREIGGGVAPVLAAQ